ncbi:MAG: toxin-antitoxin system YwqK family antitoxin [Crocinitomicaceae bacterium]
MKQFLYLCFMIFLMMACNSNGNDSNSVSDQSNEIKEQTHQTGLYQEHYDNGQLKMTGNLDNDGLKKGVWTSYFENGQKNSESNFLRGINTGYSMVWYPNGNVRYFGDYKDGERTGEWVFYSENGEVAKKESFD